MIRNLWFRIWRLFRREPAEADLDDELRFHLQRQVEKYVESGLPRDAALRRAAIEFGGLGQVKEECRDARGVHLLETLVRDFRYAVRTLRKSPGFTSVALLTLALGIGANTAIFSVVYGALLRPLPYKDASRLVVLNETTPKVGSVAVSYPNYQDWRALNRVFFAMSAVCQTSFNLTGIERAENISGEAVSPNFLSMLGLHPLLGRDFEAAEERAGTAPVVLLSYEFWQSHFAGARNVVGRTITLDGRGFTVIGILPPGFRSIDKTDVVEPVGVWATKNASITERGERGDLVVMGRLAAGKSLAQARAEMGGIAARLAREYPEEDDQFGVSLRPLREHFIGDVRPAILILFAAVMFVLLIACANVANLFLMRGAGRRKEIALRLAIGAGRGRIVGQLLMESFVLAFSGGLLGLGLAMLGIRAMASLIPVEALGGATVSLSGVVLLFAALLVFLSALVFGLTPAMISAKADVQSELKDGGRAMSGSRKQNRWHSILATSEIALALVLLVGAGLLMQSLFRLLSVDPGFQTERVLTMQMSLHTAQYGKDANILHFWEQVLERCRVLPGVETAALGTVVPLTDDHSRSDITVEGMPLPKVGNFPHPDIHIVSPGYFSALGVPLLHGRGFTETDSEKSLQAGMINVSIARRFFGHANPVGKRFMFDRPSPTQAPKWITIIGVVGDTKLYGLANPARLEVYIPYRQAVTGDMNLVVKSATDPAALTSAIRSAIAAIDKDQPVFGIATMKDLIGKSMATRRLTLILLALFSGLALVLATIGIYGVISYSVAQRTHEIGIRVALGAERGMVLRMIFAQGLRIAAAGIAIGIVVSFGLMRLMTNLLFSVSAADPLTFLAVTTLLVVIALLASYVPAHRSLHIDPMIALRYE